MIPDMTAPTRRAVLRGALGIALAGPVCLGLVSGCALAGPGGQRVEPSLSPADAAALARAVDRARLLLSLGSDGSTVQSRITQDTRAHLAALGAPESAVGPSASADVADVADQTTAELDGAAEALTDAADASPAFAVLLTRIAASRAVHADLLAGRDAGPLPVSTPDAGPSSSPEASPSPAPFPSRSPSTATSATRDALGRLITDAHAAVYGYGVVAARVADADRDRAETAWQQHGSALDVYIAALLDAGGRPPAAAPAYDLEPPADAGAAVALAARIEQAMTVRLLSTLAQTDPPLRRRIAEDAVRAVRATAAWGGEVAPLPGQSIPS